MTTQEVKTIKKRRKNIGEGGNWRLKEATLYLKSDPKKWFSVVAQTPRVIDLVWEAIEYGYLLGKEGKDSKERR